jgi:hypothetical protein
MRPNGWVVGTAFIAALVASLPIDAAAKPKQTVNAIINGHRLNLKNRQIDPGSAVVGAGGIAITAGTKFHHLGQTAKTLVVTCAAGPLAGGTLPGPGQVCTVAYTETKLALHPTSKQWSTSPGGATVTFTSFDGTRVQGTFDGTLDAVYGATGSVTVTSGTFNILVP